MLQIYRDFFLFLTIVFYDNFFFFFFIFGILYLLYLYKYLIFFQNFHIINDTQKITGML